MAKNTSILLGEYFENYINELVNSGRFSSASEVIRTALRLFEQEESKKKLLDKALKAGEKSGYVNGFDRKQHLKELNKNHSDEI